MNRQEKERLLNSEPGTLDAGFDCPLCMNRGYSYRISESGERVVVPCRCEKRRAAIRNIRRSGLADVIREKTFEAFRTDRPWQKTVKASAERFAENPGKCFFIGGASGSGKTHICTAICGKLLESGVPVRYIMWRETAQKALASITDDEEFSRLVSPMRMEQCVYIDDLFKVRRGGRISDGEVKLAFDVINARYARKNKITIISTELSPEQLLDVDEATGGRIIEMAGCVRQTELEVGRWIRNRRRLNA